jgi:hypothetical protein
MSGMFLIVNAGISTPPFLQPIWFHYGVWQALSQGKMISQVANPLYS